MLCGAHFDPPFTLADKSWSRIWTVYYIVQIWYLGDFTFIEEVIKRKYGDTGYKFLSQKSISWTADIWDKICTEIDSNNRNLHTLHISKQEKVKYGLEKYFKYIQLQILLVYLLNPNSFVKLQIIILLVKILMIITCCCSIQEYSYHFPKKLNFSEKSEYFSLCILCHLQMHQMQDA